MYRRFTVLAVLLGALSPAIELRAQPPSDDPDVDAVVQNLTDPEPSPLLTEPKDPEALFDAVVLMLDLDFGEGGVTSRTPVDDPIRAVHEVVVVEVDEHLANRVAETFVEREPLPAPVGRIAELSHLLFDGVA